MVSSSSSTSPESAAELFAAFPSKYEQMIGNFQGNLVSKQRTGLTLKTLKRAWTAHGRCVCVVVTTVPIGEHRSILVGAVLLLATAAASALRGRNRGLSDANGLATPYFLHAIFDCAGGDV